MLQSISRILNTVGQADSPLKATELFNEGWMLRLVLDHLQTEECPQHPFSFRAGAKWFSEGLLPSPFLAEFRGDLRAEGWTNADGVVGHFAISQYAKGDLSLVPTPVKHNNMAAIGRAPMLFIRTAAESPFEPPGRHSGGSQHFEFSKTSLRPTRVVRRDHCSVATPPGTSYVRYDRSESRT